MKHVAPFISSVGVSNFIASVGGLAWQWAPVQCVECCGAGHPLVTSTTPDVSLKHTDTGGGDDDYDVLEKGHYHDDDVLDVLDVLDLDGRDDDDHAHGEE